MANGARTSAQTHTHTHIHVRQKITTEFSGSMNMKGKCAETLLQMLQLL